jgi:protein-S-isoprenylcysteine O-methyltransferase Ste14
MKRTLRFILGYLTGIAIFLVLIPTGFYELSRLDYLVNYKMIISDMFLRYTISAAIFLVGIVFMIWSNAFLFIIGKGGPADAMGVSISPRTQNLVIKGPYRFCRNPMGFGAFMVYLSIVLYMNSIFGLGILLFAFILFIVFIKTTEEKRLIKDFGENYLKYRNRVPMIIPLKISRRGSHPLS